MIFKTLKGSDKKFKKENYFVKGEVDYPVSIYDSLAKSWPLAASSPPLPPVILEWELSHK